MPTGDNRPVHEIVTGVMEYLNDNLSPETIKNYKLAFDELEKFYQDCNEMHYSIGTSNLYLESRTHDRDSGRISHRRWLKSNRAVFLTNQYFELGHIESGTRQAFHKAKLKPLTQCNQEILNAYITSLRQRNLRETSLQKESYDIAVFLRYLDDSGITDIKTLTSKNVIDSIPYLSNSRKDVGSIVASVRRFLEFLEEYIGMNELVPKSLYVSSVHHKKLILGFTNSEAERILSAVDRTTATGKRDYAILAPAHESGLRSLDIRNLCLTNLKWESSEIQLISSKSHRPISIPLLKNVGDAIADYILNGRPEVNVPYLFLSSRKPYGRFGSQINHIVKKYARLSGVDRESKACIGMHAFKRGLGVSMLNADVPLSVISEVLNHARQNTAKRYLAIDRSGLRTCVMPMGEYL